MHTMAKETPVRPDQEMGHIASDVEEYQPPVKKARVSAPAQMGNGNGRPVLSLERTGEWAEGELTACFADGLLAEERMEELAADYKRSKPYLHVCLPELVQPALLRAVRTEIVDNLVFTEKETDIYKVHQTGDLANIDGLPAEERAKLACLHRLRNALYSAPFRNFISRVTGCGPLSGSKQDMSINSYKQGSHLLNHDDVIGTRCVSYILYLPEPQDWEPKYGGALELYPCIAKGTPDVDPSLVLPPKWNQFVFFTVQPGYSFHSVQEVVVPYDRLSISGWFHLPQEGEEGYDSRPQDEEAAPASLAQLEDDTRDADHAFIPLAWPVGVAPAGEEQDSEAGNPDDALTDEDRAFLAQYINKDYLDAPKLELINEKFCAESSVQLIEFLNAETAVGLLGKLRDADARDGLAGGVAPMTHGAGVLPGWTVQGSPVKQRFMVLSREASDKDVAEAAPLRSLQTLVGSQAFAKWLYQVCGVGLTSSRGRVRRFRPGLDYTLATFSSTASVLDATLCVTPPHASWGEGERGGYECYIAPDAGNDDPAVYRAALADDDHGALLTAPATWNTLTLALRDQGVMRFVKYVSALANGSRWDVAAEYLIDEDTSGEDGDK